MLKLLIVDDELLVRMGIKTSIDWNSIGFEIAGEAENGEKALEIARKTMPHVVLTDIRMPKMDGLMLIKALKSEFPKTKVVVLSCYNDSEYVREAMQFGGALDYIPKLSMKPDDLIKTMEKVKVLINQEGYKGNETLNTSNADIKDDEDKNSFFNEFIDNGEFDEKWFYDNSSRLGLKFKDGYNYIIAAMSIDKYKAVEKRNTSAIKSQLKNLIINTSDEAIKGGEFTGYTFCRTDSEFVLLLSDNANDRKAICNKVKGLCKIIQDRLLLYFNISVTFGIGSAADDVLNIRNSYKAAFTAVEFRFYKGIGSIILSEDIPSYKDKTYYDAEKEAHLRELLNNGKIMDAKNVVLDILEQINIEQSAVPLKVVNEFFEIIHTFSSVIKKYGGDLKGIKDAKENTPYKSVEYCDTLEEIKLWFVWFIDRYGEEIKHFKKKMYGEEVSKAIEYMNGHYREELKLSDVASYVAMNETYFSHLFKRETGYGFADFLNKLRIEKAKELLRTKKFSVSQVSDMAGYSSESYFSKVFKQFEGISPSEYKNQKYDKKS